MQSHNSVSYTDQALIFQIIRNGTWRTYYKVRGEDGLL